MQSFKHFAIDKNQLAIKSASVTARSITFGKSKIFSPNFNIILGIAENLNLTWYQIISIFIEKVGMNIREALIKK